VYDQSVFGLYQLYKKYGPEIEQSVSEGKLLNKLKGDKFLQDIDVARKSIDSKGGTMKRK